MEVVPVVVGELDAVRKREDTWLGKLGITINTGLLQKTADDDDDYDDDDNDDDSSSSAKNEAQAVEIRNNISIAKAEMER